MRQINRIIVHCADTPPDMDIGAATIRKWHVQERGFNSIGYHGVIRRNGRFEPGRLLETPGAHAAGHNADSLAVCLVGGRGRGGGPQNNFTPAQMRTLAALVTMWQAQFNVPDEGIMGHRDLPDVAKHCPSFDVRAWWNSIKGDAA